ncbi:MAG TPA: radical SAM protein [Candidatus Stercorousia faecigallinarum]|nr:radical SAM protein [Candidatus Stercorousia faecigallinarum]
MANTLVYLLDGKIYINLTNRCTNDCIFCLRKDKDDVKGQELWLDDENSTAEDVIKQLSSFEPTKEVIFCGYGEPLLKFEELKQVSQYIKTNYPDTKIRVNTNGHANFVYQKNIVPELKGLIDEFSVSLNAPTKKEYNELSQPKFDEAYEEVKKFIKACADEKISVVASVVEGYKGRHLDLTICENIAKDLGAKFRVREWIPNGY